MAFGGGKYSPGIYDKKLPGVYTSVRSEKQNINLMGVGGVVALPLAMNWGPEKQIMKISNKDFLNNCFSLFLCSPSHPSVAPLLETFLGGAKEILLFNLCSGGIKASSTHATALFSGVSGNRISTSVFSVTDTVKELQVLVDGAVVEKFTASENFQDIKSKYVVFNQSQSDHESVMFENGTNGTVVHQALQDFRESVEGVEYDTVACAGEIFSESENLVFSEWVTTMDNEYGKKFRVVLSHSSIDTPLNNYRVINCMPGVDFSGVIYFTAGLDASLLPGKSATNNTYTGHDVLQTFTSQEDLKMSLDRGYFMYHKDYDRTCVLSDRNSLTTFTDEVSEIFSKPNTIRTLDFFEKNVSRVFRTNFLGKVPLDRDGLDSLKGQILEIGKTLVELRAFKRFEPDSVALTAIGQDSVQAEYVIELSGVMEKLYLNSIIK